MTWLLAGQVVPSSPASCGSKVRPVALQQWLLVPTTLARVSADGERVCSQPVPQLLLSLHQAFSAFFYTVDFIRTVMGRPVHLPSDLKDAAEIVCATSWSEVGSLGIVRRGLLHVGYHPSFERALGGHWVSWHQWIRGMAPTWDWEGSLGLPDVITLSFRPHTQAWPLLA